MLDLSDGIAGDVGHLAAAGGVAIVLEAALLPVDPSARSASTDALSLALSGGEDYELCFAARPGMVSTFLGQFQAAFDLLLTRVGFVEAGEGVHLVTPNGDIHTLKAMGFQHFGAGR
jgi:thiamine-monophosphate kinase